MAVAGVIAEFDPFHLGHRYLVEEIKAHLGAETPVVAAMSGSFTQRGGAAVCSPQARAEMALLSGVDLVLELPLPFCAAAAETFGRGGVEVLTATGVVDTLCFGSECGDVSLLRRLAQAAESPAFSQALQTQNALGLPFARARQNALEQVAGAQAGVLAGANDLLGVAYLRALPEQFPVLAIPRRDGGHHGDASASRVRRALHEGDFETATELLPPATVEILRRELAAGRCPASLARAQRAVLYRLRGMTGADFAGIPDCGEGLENRLVSAAAQATSLEEFYALAKTKRYAHARIRRIALRAFLSMDAIPASVGYLRVLGASERGVALLRQMKKTATLPIVTKPAHGKLLAGEAEKLFALNRRADDVWGLCLPQIQPGGKSWKEGPVLPEKKREI